jgi:hypothetical protein
MIKALVIVLLLVPTAAFSQETAVPDTPVPTTITSYRVTGFSLEREPEWRFVIVYKDNNNKEYRDDHHGPSTVSGVNNPEGADELIRALNTANLSTNSLMKRLLQHLVQHGKIPPSTVQGAPEK